MKSKLPNLILASFAGITLSANGAEVSVYNGAFDNGSDGWQEVNGDSAAFSYDYPSAGGNPGGHGIIDNTAGGSWGIWVANFEAEELLVDLGLESGSTYTFKVDMKINSGSSIGGFKVDFFNEGNPNGSTGDVYPTLIGDGTTWETYEFQVTIPANTTGIKSVPLWGPDSAVAFDNILVDDTAITGSSSIPDADFEAADGLAWEQNSGAGDFVFSFPATGGNPGGHGVIDNSGGGGWGVLVTDNGNILTLSQIGLEAGKSYIFKQDMKRISGDNIGGFKVDFFNGAALDSSTGDIFPTLIGDGSTWETYEFQISIPSNSTGIKVVPLWGANSVVGFDNIAFDPVAIEVPDITEIPNSGFEEGAADWAAYGQPNTVFTYETSDGNPNGYAVMTNDGEGYGVLVSNNGGTLPLAGLGLSSGSTYNFTQDMKIFSGSEVGGLKVEFYNSGAGAGDTGDIRIPVIGDGSTWETYQYQIAIPLGVDSIKVVPLWGSGSSVGFDNVTFDSNRLPSPPVINHDFEAGGANWSFFAAELDENGQNSELVYRETGGNPGGYAEIKNFSNWAVLVANQANVTPIENFGITEEGNYEFKMDMKIFEGASIGGLKIEFYLEGRTTGEPDFSSPEAFPFLIGDGSTWETYTFDVFIQEGVTGMKIVPLWGAGSTVGYDNIVTPQAGASGFTAWINSFPNVGTQSGFNDDPDHDGTPNGLENFFGTDPSVSNQGLVAGITIDSAFSTFFFSHPQSDSPAEDISEPIYEWSTDLENFYGSGEANPDNVTMTFNIEDNTPAVGFTTVEASVTGSLQEKVFVRVRVAQAVQ